MIIQQKDIEISMYLKFWFYIIFNQSVHPLISSTKSGTLARVRVALGFMLDRHQSPVAPSTSFFQYGDSLRCFCTVQVLNCCC